MFETKRRLVGALFERNSHALLRYLTRRAGRDNAPDLLNETFIRALGHDHLEEIVDPPAFLQRIAINLTRDFKRRAKSEGKRLEFGEPPTGVPADEIPVDERIDQERKRLLVSAAIEALPPQCRRVFEMVMQEGVPAKEAARRLGITDTMVRRHLNLAILRCRNSLPE
ncbi:RNA polymerase sigma factor [Methylosinus sp. LW4]|uniref:RNA polymerase sigma factor n=1 Tax=Methylosinus sp. LW4 TaxID=136993 RepID=UPI0003754E81|nr:RNA polymerase sigma factor [Methylosinus sp. LW4]